MQPSLKLEAIRNMSAYFLVIMGIVCLLINLKFHDTILGRTGETLVTSSLLAFQAKRTPDGNTTTTQVTTPVNMTTKE